VFLVIDFNLDFRRIKMTKHTPLPWRITLENYDAYGNYKQQIGTSEKTICYTYCPCDYAPPPTEMLNNGEFIVRAVNNHYALIEALEWAHLYSEKLHPNSNILKVLKKAKGE
jgi:hypothetical protein